MIRWAVVLVAVLYIGMIVVPGADHGENVEVTRSGGQNWLVALITNAEEEARTPPAEVLDLDDIIERAELTDDLIETDQGYALETARGEVLDIAAVINPADLAAERGSNVINAVSVVDPDAAAAATAGIVDERIIWRVTGNRVNFRAGPSTNTAILTGLVRGDQVQFLADAPDGWAHLRVLSSGLEGYMAARFLEPVN